MAPALHILAAMIHRVGACIFVSLLAVGCGVGNDDLEETPTNPNGLTCSDAFKISGTFAPGTPARPIDMDTGAPITGCWPVGTWTFTVTRDPGADNVLDLTGDGAPDRCGEVAKTTAPTIDASYAFTVKREYVVEPTEEGYIESYQMTGAVEDAQQIRWNGKVLHRLKVTEGGGGECEGGVEIYSADGLNYWNLKPALTGTTLSGFGDYAAYEKSQLVENGI